VAKLTIGPENISGTLRGSPGQAFVTVRVNDPDLVKELDERKVSYSGRHENRFWAVFSPGFSPWHLFPDLAICHEKDGAGMGVMSFSKSKAKIFARAIPRSPSLM
jgi:cell division protease FtsH